MEIIKTTKTHGTLIIKRIDKALAKDMIVRGHYSHKWQSQFGIYSYGIFRASAPGDCLGVAAYGYMKNCRARIFTSDVPNGWMCELNRMWIDDSLGKNAETVLIAASLKLLRQDDPTIVAVQSFADGRLGCGTVYKAANFQYYGWHWTAFFRNKKTGEITHEQNLRNTTTTSTFLRANVEDLAGNMEAMRVKTYRYIYPIHKSFRFITKQKQYPDYEKGTHPYVRKLRKNLRNQLHRCIDTLVDRAEKRSSK